MLKGYKLSKETKAKHRIHQLGNRNSNWVGNKVTYRALHAWVVRNKPKSMFCEKCGKITNKLDCSNISGEYKRDIGDYRWLCRSCHMREDGRITNLKQFKHCGGKL